MPNNIHYCITSCQTFIQNILDINNDNTPLSTPTAKAYLRHINAFACSDLAKNTQSLDDIDTASLQRWISRYATGSSKYKQTSAALKFIGNHNNQEFHAAYEITPPRAAKSSKTEPRYISRDQLQNLRTAPLAFFGSMYPERNRAIALLTLDTLADMDDIRHLRNIDVTSKSIIFTNRPLDQRDMGVPSWTLKVMHDYRRWRTNKYGKDQDSAPFFRSNRGGREGEALTPSGIYRIFHKIVLALGFTNQRSGEGHNIFRISCARKMYIEGCSLDRLTTLFGIREREGAILESLHITDDMQNARQKTIERNQLFNQGKNTELPAHRL